MDYEKVKLNFEDNKMNHVTFTSFKYIEHKTSEGKINYFRV